MYCNVQIKKIITIDFNNYNNFCTNYHFGKRKTSRHLGKNDSQCWWLRYTKTTLLYQFVFIKLQCSDKIHLTQKHKRDNRYKISIFYTFNLFARRYTITQYKSLHYCMIYYRHVFLFLLEYNTYVNELSYQRIWSGLSTLCKCEIIYHKVIQ